jgi:hypothetical protein
MNLSGGTEALILSELRKISKVLMLAHSEAIEAEIEKIAQSDGRKKMWVLVDGKRMPKDLAKDANVTTMAVSYFLESASAAGFVQYTQREPPKKILDYVPPSWIALIVTGKETEPIKQISASKPSAPATAKQQDKQSEGIKQ